MAVNYLAGTCHCKRIIDIRTEHEAIIITTVEHVVEFHGPLHAASKPSPLWWCCIAVVHGGNLSACMLLMTKKQWLKVFLGETFRKFCYTYETLYSFFVMSTNSQIGSSFYVAGEPTTVSKSFIETLDTR